VLVILTILHACNICYKGTTARKIMKGIRYFAIIGAIATAVWVAPCGFAQSNQLPNDYQEALTILGKKGDFKDNVLKIGIPRNDLKVEVAGVKTPTSFGFGGWVAMTKGEGDNEVAMGDLVLLEDEVNPVMSALLENGLEVTALHNHFFWETPRVFYMHVHGHGKAADLAQRLKPALALIGKSALSSKAEAPSVAHSGKPVEVVEGRLSVDSLESAIGHKAERTGPVLKFTIGRDDLKIHEMGAVINTRMGLNTWAAFVGTDENAAVAGDVAMLETEVNSVLKALRENGLDVVAIHQHMFGTKPNIIFLHYWGTGPAAKLASGFKAALNELGRGSHTGSEVSGHHE
jgi:hypothetical protein